MAAAQQQGGGQGSTGSGGGTGAGTGGGTTTTTPGGSVPGTGRPGTTTPTSPSTMPGRDQSPFPSEMPRPIIISGKVVLSDGMPPPEPVMIERVCGTRVIPEGYTDSKGRFGFELGSNRGVFMDASNSSFDSDPFSSGGTRSTVMSGGRSGGGVTERSLFGCELRANLAGFRSEAVSLANRRSMDNPDVGTIVLRRLANVEGLTISATSMAAPKDARKAYDKGREALKKGKFEEAARQLDKALELYPSYAVAWFERGRAHEAQNNIEEAKKAYAEALKVDSKLILPYERLAGLALQARNWQEAADTSERMIRLNPVDFPVAFLYNSIANLNLQNLDAAEKSAVELLKMDPQHRVPKAEHVMAVILAQKEDWEKSATHFRSFIQLARPGNDVELAKKQLAEVEKTLAAQKQN
jgi:tetratricopeptide (TPR) repeat protein